MRFFLLIGLFSICQYLSAYEGGGATLQELSREVRNQKQLIQNLEAAQENGSSILESFRKEFRDSMKASKELIAHTQESSESKLPGLEASISALTQDIKKMRELLNELSTNNAQLKERIASLEKKEKSDAQKITHLESSMNHLMEALSPPSPSIQEGRYQVSSGDSLEKIARRNNISVRALKEANNLTSDQIRVGQTLLIPK